MATSSADTPQPNSIEIPLIVSAMKIRMDSRDLPIMHSLFGKEAEVAKLKVIIKVFRKKLLFHS